MLLQIQVELGDGLPTHAGYAFPFIEQIIDQLKEGMSPKLDLVNDVLEMNDSALICESADVQKADDSENPRIEGRAQRVCLRITVERTEFDRTVRSYTEAGEEGVYKNEFKFGTVKPEE